MYLPDQPVRICDLNPEKLQPPFVLKMARGVKAPYLANGAMTFGFHCAPRDLGDYHLTTIIDESSPRPDNPTEKLMVQSGVQYGCSVRACPFCVYLDLRYQRNLTAEEISDLYRLALFVHAHHFDHHHDTRQLVLKLTDDGEPLENPALPEALDRLLAIFGAEGKILNLKLSTVLKSSARTRTTWQRVLVWQRKNFARASVHLQISVIPGIKGLIGETEAREMVKQWLEANSRDQVCFAPGLVRGYDQTRLVKYCQAMIEVRGESFFRLSVIKPSCVKQAAMALGREELAKVNAQITGLGLVVGPLPQNSLYDRQLEAVGTLSHLPDGRFFDPATYQLWDFDPSRADPNVPL